MFDDPNVVLHCEKIDKIYPGTKALDQVSFDVLKGKVNVLIGENGAGKSTLMKMIAGIEQPSAGKMYMDGQEVYFKDTNAARAKGIGIIHQELSLFPNMTVYQNIFMGHEKKKGFFLDDKAHSEGAKKILQRLEHEIPPETMVGDLRVGQQQMVEIARNLNQDDLRVLIMDEPTASLSDNEIENMFKIVKDLRAKGISIVYVSHRLEELPIICDRISVYRDGHYIKTMNIEDAPKQVIIENMVGKHMTQTEQVRCYTDEVLLEAKNFSSGKKFQNINLTLHKGEILGIAGLAGAGRTEFVRALFGADPKDSGQVFIEGKEVQIHSPKDAKKAGLGFITEDRKEEGLILNMDLHTNVGMAILDQLKKGFGLDLKRESVLMDEYIKSLSIKCRDSNQKAKALSGGNQQKVVIAKWLATKPKVLIMDEPTRGIDIGSKNQIYALINDLAKQGIGIIMISSELPEVLQVANNIVVFAAGKVTGRLENKDLTQDILLDYATSQKAV